MNIEIVLYSMLIFIAGLAFAGIVCSCAYDILNALMNKPRSKGGNKSQKLNPHITLILYLDKIKYDELDNCLRSIAASTYKKYDVVVADSMDSNASRYELMNLLKSNSIQRVYFYKSRHKMTMKEACLQAYKRSKRGEYVLVISPSMLLQPDTLERIVHTIQLQAQQMYIDLPLLCTDPLSIETSYVSLKLASQNVIRKARALFLKANVSRLEIGNVYSKDIIEGKDSMHVEIYHDSYTPMCVTAASGWSYTKMRDGLIIKFLYAIVAITAMVCAGYAAMTDLNQPLLLLWAITIFWAIASLYQAGYISFFTKFHLSVSAWLAMFIYAAHYLVALGFKVIKISKAKL